VVKATYRASIVLLLLASCFSTTQLARAQVAPTNSAAISGSVSDSSGKRVVNANVTLSGPRSAATQTDAHGLFVFVGVPFGTYQLSAAAQGLGTVTRSITVEGDTNIVIQYQPLGGNLKVIANVSSSANALFNITPASITQVSPIANAFEGKTSWRTILEQIPGVAQAGLGNGENSQAGLPDSPIVPMQISINGALPYETATLLDDMPLIGGSFGLLAGSGTNLANYPLNGFDSADVVRGPGANAPSIVDSIGGSLVLHPFRAIEQNNYNVSVSTDPYGGIVANALMGLRWKKFSVVMTYGVNDSPGPLASAHVMANYIPATINGESFSCTGACHSSLPATSNYSGFPSYGYQTALLVCCAQNSTAWNQHSGSIAVNYALSPSANFELFYGGTTVNQRSLPIACTNIFTPPSSYSGSIAAGQYILPATFGTALEPIVFKQASSLLEEKLTMQVGRGTLRLAALQNRTFSSCVFSIDPSGNVQLFGGGTLNGMPAVFNGGSYNVTYTPIGLDTRQQSNNRDLLVGYSTPIGENFHAGTSFVKSYYDIPSQQSFQFGSFLGGNSLPSSVSQATNEFRLFIGGNLSARTSLDLSAYFVNADYHVQNPNDPTLATYIDEHYTYAAPRLGFVWRPTASLAVRAAAGGGFAEAPLFDLVGSNGTPDCSSGTSCVVTLTNTNLQPEKSFSFDLGTDIRLRRNTVLSLDIYRSNLYGQFYGSTSSTGTYLGLPLYTTQIGNLGESRYEGVLLDLRHDVPQGLYWSISGGLTRGYLVSVPAGFYNDPTVPCINCTNLTVVPNVNFNGTFDASIPYSQALGTLGYRWNPEKYINIVGTYYGNNNTYFRPAFVEWDANLGYPVHKNVALLVTFRNITGIYNNAEQIWGPTNLSGAPTMSGKPYPLFGEEYGPRTIIVTTMFHLQ